jgi:hypothetical protein
MYFWITEQLSDFCRWRYRRHLASAAGWLTLEKTIIKIAMWPYERIAHERRDD